ncbi:MAG: N-formylglutamate amidohydrolase [Caldilineaceae bacterium]|nr:N-formylglutamate amidohydrolase [Caldilineaceae bacterium]
MSLHPLPIVQSCPHAGLGVPAEIRDKIAITSVDLYNDSDLWADLHYDFAHADLAPLTPPGCTRGTLAMVKMPIARALIDVNRHPDDLSNPDGPVKLLTSYGRTIYKEPPPYSLQVELLNRYWHAYHLELRSALQNHLGEMKLFLDCHSMAQHGPSSYNYPNAVRPLISLSNLGDAHGEPAEEGGVVSCPGWFIRRAAQIADDLFHDLQLLEPTPGVTPPTVAINWPFRGGYIVEQYTRPGYLATDRSNSGIELPPAMLVEVNRGLFVGDQNADTPISPPNHARIALIRERLYLWAARVVGSL